MWRVVTSLLLAVIVTADTGGNSRTTSIPETMTAETPTISNISRTPPCHNQSSSMMIPSVRLDTVQHTFRLLEEGEQYLKLAEKKDIILVMGNTGAGKSTFALFMTRDNSKLISVEKSVGQFVIVDENNKIGTSTITSKTIYPDVIADEMSNLYFVDCPGFQDTRSASYDIAATYLIHRVVEKAENVKIIFVVNYASLRSGGDRRDFMALLKHATNFVRDIDKLKNSIGLVASKVENVLVKIGRSYTLITDENVKSGIAAFLEEIKSDIETMMLENKPGAQFHAMALQLIDVFLTKDGEDYNKFDIFRRPDEPGPLSKNELLMEGKERLKKLVSNSTKYFPIDSDDFGFTISEETKNEINNFVDGIDYQVTADVMIVAKQIKTHFRNNELGSPFDLWQIQEQFRKDYTFVQSVLKETGDSITIKLLLGKLITIVGTANIMMSSEPFKRIANNKKYLEFLQNVSDKELKIRPSDWEKPFNSIIENLQFAMNSYEYLVKLDDWLSGYEIQEDTSKYNVADLKDWGKVGRPQGIHITANNLGQFLMKFDSLNHDDAVALRDDPYKISILSSLVEFSLTRVPQLRVEGTRLVVKGVYVKLSDIQETLKSSRYNIRTIEIYAQHSVYIDVELMFKGKMMDLSILSPNWVVVGKRKIVLDGEIGSPKDTNGITGAHGEVGNAGGAAGTFFGVGRKFVNGLNLTISAHGGKGGRGQDGSNGHAGKNGDTDSNKQYVAFEDLDNICKNYRSPRFVFCYIDLEKNVDDSPEDYGDDVFLSHFNVYFTVGGRGVGGAGGDGGAGGTGGRNGSVRVIALQEASQIVRSSNKGQHGESGHGGLGGIGGKDGCKYTVGIYASTEMHLEIFRLFKTHSISDPDCNVADGPSGSNGINNKEVEASYRTLSYPNPSRAINNFKSYLREHTFTDLKILNISGMLAAVENSPEISQLYDVAGLVDDLQSVELQFYKLKSKKIIMSYYQSMSKRIIDVAVKLHPSSLDDRRVLNYLYIATLCKISSLKNVSAGFHIIDIKAFLDLAITNINNWQDLTLKEAIQQHNQDYQRNADKKIASANEFIETQITGEFNNINKQIEGQIDRLLNQVIEQIRDAEKNKLELEKSRRELKRALELQQVFGGLKICASALNFLGPWGAAAGELVGTASSIAESLTMNKNAGGTRRTVVPQAVKLLLQAGEASINAITDRRLAALNKKLEAVTSEMKNFPDQLGRVDDVKEIDSIKSLLAAAKSAKVVDLKQISVLEGKLNGHMEKKRTELTETKSAVESTLRNGALKAIKHLTTASQIADTAVDVYNKYKDQEEQLAEIGAQIDGEQEAIKKLKQYEESVHSVMEPLISGLSEDIRELEGELGGKSQIGLDVAKWQIQSKIRDMKLQMQQFTRGYELEENMARCFEKLDEAMSVLITVYDRIQDFQEQKKLADLITAVGSPAADVIQINNAEMSRAVNRLEMLIKSNIILSQYARAVSSFKQFVFPFAESYLQEYTLPRDLHLGNSTHLLVEKAARNIRSLRAKITESGAVISNNEDTHVYYHEFNSRHNTTSSFHVWKRDSYQSEISYFLSGKEIALKANIRENNDLNAVKFNLIRLQLKTENESLQSALDAALQYYSVRMTHLGNSYYRCDGRFYVIPSDSVTIAYSFKLNGQGEPQTRNEVYNKLKKGDITLSPYAMWKIQLIGRSYDRLQQFQNQVDVELEGHGTYVGKDAKVCASNLERHYTSDHALSDLNNIRVDHN